MAQPRRVKDDARMKVSASEPTFRYPSNLIGSSRWPSPDEGPFRRRAASEEKDVTAWVPGGYRERMGHVPMTLHIERSQEASGKAALSTKRERLPAICASASQPNVRALGDAGSSSRNVPRLPEVPGSRDYLPAPLVTEAGISFVRAAKGRRRRSLAGTDPQLTLKALFPPRPKWLSEAEEQEIRERFNQYDHDHDGLLNISELRKALKALGNYVSEVQLRELMEDMDGDDSGTIELRELLDYMQSHPQRNMNTSKAVVEQEASALFATMASHNRGVQPRGRERVNSVTGILGVADVRGDTPDEAATVDLHAIDEFLRSEFDLEGFAEMQKEMIGASGADGSNDGKVKLKDFTRVLATGRMTRWNEY